MTDRHIIDRLRDASACHGYPSTFGALMAEAADRIEAMQTAGAAMARRLDELEPGPFDEEEVETIATGTVLRVLRPSPAQIEWDGWAVLTPGARVALIAIPDFVEVAPT